MLVMFRHRKQHYRFSRPRLVYETILKREVRNGVTYSTPVKVPVDGSHIPEPSQYLLHDLLDANISLSRVNPQVVGSVPTDSQVDAIVNSIVDSDKISE